MPEKTEKVNKFCKKLQKKFWFDKKKNSKSVLCEHLDLFSNT